MRVAVGLQEGRFIFRLRLDEGESLNGLGQLMGADPVHWRANRGIAIRLVTNEVSISHPSLSADIHPDLVALVALTMVAPWAGGRLTLTTPVSGPFADAVAATFGIGIGPTSQDITSRRPGDRFGLLYSGGADSAAFLEVAPENVELIHLRRVRHPRVPNRANHLRSDVSERYARLAETPQRPLHVVATDLEFLCQPFPTFPTWPALLVGGVLLADVLDLGGLGVGTMISGRYLASGLAYRPDGDRLRDWAAVFDAAGIPIVAAMGGASEMLTRQIVADAGKAANVRSCQLGSIDEPCLRCAKCLRKGLIEAAAVGAPLSQRLLERVSSNDKVVLPLIGLPPYAEQHTLEYVLPRVVGLEGTFLEATRSRLNRSIEETEFLARYYVPAFDAIADRWRPGLEERVRRVAPMMSNEECRIVEAWDATAHLSTGLMR